MERKKNDKLLASIIIGFWLLAGAYYVGQKYLAIENSADEMNGLTMIAVTPEKLGKKVLDADLINDPFFRSLTKSSVSQPDAKDINAGNRSPFFSNDATKQ